MTSSGRHKALWLAVLALVAGFPIIHGGVVIDMHFERYRHDCDEDPWPVESDCDPMFTFCLGRAGANWALSHQNCFYGLTHESNHYQNNNDVWFGALIGGKISNPWTNRRDRLMDPSIVFVVRVRDDDTAGGDDHMWTRGTDLTLTLYNNKSEALYEAKTLAQGGHNLQYKIRMYCEANFYGGQCDIYCNANEGNYTCETGTGNMICLQGWNGTICDEDIDECASNICQRGRCENTPGDYFCHCPPFYTGKNCEQAEDPCEGNPCKHNGNCTVETDPLGFNCTCQGPWTGDTCSVWVDPCSSEPCDNGGECINIGQQTDEFWCNCTEEFNGTLCGNEINPTTTATPNKTPDSQAGTGQYKGSDGGSDGFEPWMAAVICGAVLICAVILIVCIVVRRRRKRKQEVIDTTLPPGDSVVFSGRENLAFQNVMYNDINRRNERQEGNHNGIITPLPTTPTDDDDFDMIKPVFSPATLEEGGATGGYHSMDNDGYEKPEKIIGEKPMEVSPYQSERAQANPYSDFSHISSKRQNEKHDDDEPHYQDLDEVSAAMQGLDDSVEEQVDQSPEVPTGKLRIIPDSATNDIVDTNDPLQSPILFKGFAGLQSESSSDGPKVNPYNETPSNTPKNSVRQHEPYTDVPINTPRNSLGWDESAENPPLPPSRINSFPLGSPKEEEEVDYSKPTPKTKKSPPHKEGPYADVPVNGLKSKDPFAENVLVEDDKFDADLPNPGAPENDNRFPQGSSTTGSHYDSPRASLNNSAPSSPDPSSESPVTTQYSMSKPSPYDEVKLSDDSQSVDDLPVAPPPPGTEDEADGEDTDKDTAQLTPHLKDQNLFMENAVFSMQDEN